VTRSPFSHIAIIGTGLIGGSIGLAIHERYPHVRVTGFDRPEILREALRRKAIDVTARTLRDAVAFADLIILSAPVTAIRKMLPSVAACASSHAVITDTGSVKQSIVQKAPSLFPAGNFIGGHPMAGAEFSGVQSAHPLLFENAYWILTPSETTASTTRLLSGFYKGLGARVVTMDPETHDSVLAMLSHVPQLAAVALVNSAGRRHPRSKNFIQLGAGGFRDLTRIASSPFAPWGDILKENHQEIDKALVLLIDELRRYQKRISGNGNHLAASFATAAAVRRQIPRGMKGFIAPPVEITVFVPDQPGMLAKLTGALARESINLKDLELLKVREGRGGTFRLAFESERDRKKAEKVVKHLFPR
jgi:prephenate dehydrogenase